ncbi:heme exporter protein CcmD [Rubrimonas cliftonensis]|uniref:Heme exporter protein D n=1 Tax=Rubrimonas cliftonensis TaxID=89524 RepID=A0A1H3XES7_9RHOB|nr:heme exporter protein CcmD [Rubrimonas cliftonensis]SDZ97907.1 heme exporter protein CcmD [Rubrimonas cliftonensis]
MGFLAEGAHWDSVIAAYAVTATVMGALVWFSLVEARRARRELDALDARERSKNG